MSGHGGGGPSPIGWILLIIAGAWILWYFSGGANGANTTEPFIQSPIDDTGYYSPGH